MAQQATLETRDAKHEPRALTEQRAAWHTQAAETLGGPDAIQTMINGALNPSSAPSPAVDAEWVTASAEKVLAAVEEDRSTWQAGMSAPKHNARSGPRRFPPIVSSSWFRCCSGGAPDPIGVVGSPRRRHHRAGGLASDRRFEHVHGCRIRPVHLRPDPGRRAATRRGRRPYRRPGRGGRNGGFGLAGIRRDGRP